MGKLLEELIVKYKVDKSELSTALKDVKREMSGLREETQHSTGAFKNLFSGAVSMAAGVGIANLAGDAFGFLKDQVKGVFEESLSAQEGMAQTNAVIKSTHDVSGMTADAVANLAGEYSHLTRFSDDTIQSAENMLLTFTNIGKNVFPQATKTVLDMSQALGQDTKSSAIQLGKALNDPIAGVTALQRVGVTFDDSQKKLIKTYMEHNQVAKAQGVILKELQKEFGDTAEAAGRTLPGQFDILKQRLADVEQSVGDALMPVLEQFTGYVSSKVMPVVGKFSDWFTQNATPVIQKFATILGNDASNAIQQLGSFISNDLLPPAHKMFDTAGQIIENFIKWNDKTHFLQNTMQDVGGLIKRVADDVATKLMPPVKDAISNFQQWLSNSNSVHDALGLLGDITDKVATALGGLIQGLSDVFGWFAQDKDRANALKTAIELIGTAIVGVKIVKFGQDVFSTLQKAGKDVHNFIDTVGKIKDKLGDVLSFFTDKFGPGAKGVLNGKGGVASAAEDVTTAEKGIATQAVKTEATVATETALMDGELKGVGTSANIAKKDITGIGPAAASAEVAGTSAFGAFAAGMVSTAIGAIFAIEMYMLQDAIPALAASYRDNSYRPPSGPGAEHYQRYDTGVSEGSQGAGRAHHALGTSSAPGGPSIVAEDGAELVMGPRAGYLPRGSRVFNHSDTMDMMSGSNSSSQPIIITVEMDTQVMAQANARTTDRHVRLKLGAGGRAA